MDHRPLARFADGVLQLDDGGIYTATTPDWLRFKRAVLINVPWAASDIDNALAAYERAQKETRACGALETAK